MMTRTRPWMLTFTLLLLWPALSAAQSLTTADLDARIEKQLYEVLTLGTDIYNRGGKDACFRLYQGSLMSIVGFLDHRPDQVAKINTALKATDQMTAVNERAFTLRTAIDDLRASIKPALVAQQKPATNPPVRSTLWDRLGGEVMVTMLVEELVTRVMKNPRVNFTRQGTGNQWEPNPENISKLKKQFILWISSVSGGPAKYEQKDMKTVHQKMKITPAEYEAFMLELKASLEKYFVSPALMNELMNQFDTVRKDIVDDKVVVKSLWDRLGGEPAVALVVDDFISRVSRNTAINFARKDEGKEWKGTPAEIAALKKHLIQWISSVTNGPLKYEGKTMAEVHAGMKITNAQFTALMLDLKASLDVFKVNQVDQDELLSAVSSLRKEIVEGK